METLNKIVNRGGNVNFTTTITAEEANNTISLFAQLVNLSKFALASQPEGNPPHHNNPNNKPIQL